MSLSAMLMCAFINTAAAEDQRLVDAAQNRNRVAVQRLVLQHVDVNAAQADGATALHWATHWDDVDTADLLIRAGANVNAANDLGVTPLGLACGNGSGEMVAKLLAAGADAKGVSAGEPVLMIAARTGSVAAVKALIGRGASVNAAESSLGHTALMWAAANKHADVVKVLVEHGADVRARSRVSRLRVNTSQSNVGADRASSAGAAIVDVDYGGYTPLLFAARHGDVESANVLLSAGANINEVAADGASAIVVAAHSGHGAFARFLLEHGADSNSAAAGYTALHAAVLRGDMDLVKALLASGADPNARLTKGSPVRRNSQDFAFDLAWAGATPFWLAARFGEVEMMRVLAETGADPSLPISDSTTPLITAVSESSDSSDRRGRRVDPLAEAARPPALDEQLALEAAKIIVRAGVDINVGNATGDTPLHCAASKGYATVVQFLVENGGKMDAKNKRGVTPIEVKPERFNRKDPRSRPVSLVHC